MVHNSWLVKCTTNINIYKYIFTSKVYVRHTRVYKNIYIYYILY
jgi:hypothetical protein